MVGLKLKEENGGSCYHPNTLKYERV